MSAERKDNNVLSDLKLDNFVFTQPQFLQVYKSVKVLYFLKRKKWDQEISLITEVKYPNPVSS
jgi:hypothetical protein